MASGRYGIHGGQYIPETLMNEVKKLEECYEFYKNDKEFNEELDKLLREYAGRPSLLYYAKKMTEDLGGAKIYLKREDLNHLSLIINISLLICYDCVSCIDSDILYLHLMSKSIVTGHTHSLYDINNSVLLLFFHTRNIEECYIHSKLT